MARNIDRIGPTRRPPKRPVGYQRWRSLLFMHWPVPVEVLRPLVPAPLSIDLYDGVAYVGLIPFALPGIWPAGVPEALALRFPETNVRTYVHRNGEDPGVYFFSLDAGSRLAVEGARRILGLPYFHARLRVSRRGDQLEYASHRLDANRARHFSRCEAGEHLGPAQPGTLDHFLIERYLLHVRRGDSLLCLQIHHQPYPLRRARVLALDDELMPADGLPQPDGPPPLVHFSEGVDVETFLPRRHPAPAG